MEKEQNNKLVDKEKMATVLQSLSPSVTPIHFTTQQPGR